MNIPIEIQGAREHNLKNIRVTIPPNQLVVLSGPSGSGKSSLAFDTLFAESQRRFIDCLPIKSKKHFTLPYKPDVDRITGLPPSICIEQKIPFYGSKTQLGTITGLSEYFKILFATIGIPHDPHTGVELTRYTSDEIIQELEQCPSGTRLSLLAPIGHLLKDSAEQTFLDFQRQGFLKIAINDDILDIDEIKAEDLSSINNVGLVIDRIILRDSTSFSRLADSLETAFKVNPDLVKTIISTPDNRQETIKEFYARYHNPDTGFMIPNLSPKNFSTKSPSGYCLRCEGQGYEQKVNQPCQDCQGTGLNALALSVTITINQVSYNYPSLLACSFETLARLVPLIPLSQSLKVSLDFLLDDLNKRLYYLNLLGLNYLSPSRTIGSLSGGEIQRSRLAGQLGGGLSGVLYILDEPTRGLHPEDTQKLLQALLELRDKGNTILTIEHDDAVIRHADYLIDMGPGAGVLGGEILARGTPKELENNEQSPTGNWISGKNVMPAPDTQVSYFHHQLVLDGAQSNNIHNLQLTLPLGHIIGLAGPSGSGKSTLVRDCLIPAIQNKQKGLTWSHIQGHEQIDKIIYIDQSPIGDNPRSTPASATGLLTIIRQLYAQLPLSKQRGYKPNRFSTLTKGGRCERCLGLGYMELDLDFLTSNLVECEACHGQRYNRETLEVTWKGRSIAELLAMRIDEACHFFESIPKAAKILRCLQELGLGYLTLDRQAGSLSGGESQRIKIATQLSKQVAVKQHQDDHFHFIILDEPTTGLHFNEIYLLILALIKLKRQGHTILCIEHNTSLLSSVDYLIDMGPGAGDQGGKIVNQGTVQKIIQDSNSPTANWLSLPTQLF